MKKTDGIYLPPDTSLYTHASKDSPHKPNNPIQSQPSLQQWLEAQRQPLAMVVVRQTPALDGKFLLELSLLKEGKQPNQGSSLIQLVANQSLGTGSLLQVIFSKGEAQLLQPKQGSEAQQQLQISLNYQLLRLSNKESLLAQLANHLIAKAKPASSEQVYTALASAKPLAETKPQMDARLLSAQGLKQQIASAEQASPANSSNKASSLISTKLASLMAGTSQNAASKPLGTTAAASSTGQHSQNSTLLTPLLAPMTKSGLNLVSKDSASHPALIILNIGPKHSLPTAQPERIAPSFTDQHDSNQSLSKEQLQPWLRSQLLLLKQQLILLKQNPQALKGPALARLLASGQTNPSPDNEFASAQAPKLNQWLSQQLSLAAPLHQLESSIGLMFLPFWHKDSWHELPYHREQCSDDRGQKGWRYRFYLQLPPLQEFCAELELFTNGLKIHFWCQDANTLALLNQQSQQLSQRLQSLDLDLSIDCLFGMPPKPKAGPQSNQGPGQQLDLHI